MRGDSRSSIAAQLTMTSFLQSVPNAPRSAGEYRCGIIHTHFLSDTSALRLMRLLDKRFSGVARGVGTAKILGRIHSAQIKLNDLYLPVGFSVLEGRDVDLLFGLDMLKRHQACIDLEKNCLRIQGREVRFLSEHELPAKARHVEELAGELDNASAAGLPPGGVAPLQPHAASSSSAAGSSSSGGRFPGSGQSLGTSGPAPAPTTSSIGTSGASFPEADLQAVSADGNCRAEKRLITLGPRLSSSTSAPRASRQSRLWKPRAEMVSGALRIQDTRSRPD